MNPFEHFVPMAFTKQHIRQLSIRLWVATQAADITLTR